jgi:hypothetical protein
MTTDDTRRHPLEGKVDFTFMYAAHDAFHRDLRRLAGAVEAARTAEPAVRAGWATLKNQLHERLVAGGYRIRGLAEP